MGREGHGPSTLLRLVAGLETPDAGVVQVDGQSLEVCRPEERGMAYVVLPGQVDQLVAFGAAPETVPPIVLIDTDGVGADEGRPITDEERRALAAACELPATVIFSTDDQALALAVSDRIAVLHEGRLAQVGEPDELLRRPRNTFVATLLGAPPMNVVRAILEKDGCAIQVGPRSLPLPGEITETYCRDVFMGVRPEHLRLRRDGSRGWPGLVIGSRTHAGRTYVDVEVDGGRLVVLDDPGPPPVPGDRVGLTLSAADLVVFDDRGDRLEIRD